LRSWQTNLEHHHHLGDFRLNESAQLSFDVHLHRLAKKYLVSKRQAANRHTIAVEAIQLVLECRSTLSTPRERLPGGNDTGFKTIVDFRGFG
jgi:hypothetical protein